MSAEIQAKLIEKVVTDWARSDDCSGVDALVAIMEILCIDPYEKRDEAHAASGGGE